MRYLETYPPTLDNSRGLFAFGSTALVFSLYHVHVRHINVPNAIVGMALFYGGLAEFLAGMWAFAAGNTFGATSEYRAFFHLSGSSFVNVLIIVFVLLCSILHLRSFLALICDPLHPQLRHRRCLPR